MAYQWFKAGLLEGAGVEPEAALVAAERAVALPALLPVAQRPADGARKARAHAAARRQVPGAVRVVGEKRPPVEGKQPLGEALELGAATRFQARRERVESPGVDPDVAPVEGQLALVQHDGPVLAEQLAQPVQRAGERPMRRIAIDARPER